jgi:hypothetical protein
MTRKKDDDLPIFVVWMDFVKWLFPVTEKLPRRVRFSLADRMNNLSLDVVEDLVEARYAKKKVTTLKRANLRLEKLRILLRLCHDFRYVSYNTYEHGLRAINEAGRMMGGWIRERGEGP